MTGAPTPTGLRRASLGLLEAITSVTNREHIGQ